MTTQILNAVFQDGAFHPIPDVHSMMEGQQVRLVVELEESVDVLSLAGAVFEGLSEEDIDDVEQIALKRDNSFKPSVA